MPKTLTLENIPDEVYGRLKASAAESGRSMNSEAIVCLEANSLPAKIEPVERLARARALRGALAPGQFETPGIDAQKKRGRS